MRLLSFFSVVTATLACQMLSASELTPIDLSAFQGRSHLEFTGGRWAVPLGKQVLGGIPWKVDGIIELFGRGPSRFGHFARTNVTGIPVGAKFDQLHILGGTSAASDDGDIFASLTFEYDDGTDAEIPIKYGYQFRDWYGPRYGAEEPMLDPNTRIVWRNEIPYSSQYDRGLRLYDWKLDNPQPGKTVRSISLRSKLASSGLIVLGLTYGMADSPRLADTISIPTYLEPGIKTRTGALVPLRGVVRNQAGDPLTNALVIVIGLRQPGSSSDATELENPAEGEREPMDEQGRFTLSRTTDQYNYNVVAVAKGYASGTYLGADPLRGEIEIRLEAAMPPPPESSYVQVRLTDDDGKPVIGARAEPDGVSVGGSTRWGGSQGFPDFVVSNAEGEFTFSRSESFERLQLDISAAGLAPAKIWLPATNTVQVVAMGTGGFITGRVVKDDRPIPGARVGVSGTDRNSMVYAGHYETTTDGEGRFIFRHLPPDTSWQLYGLMESIKPYGSVPPQPAVTRSNGTTNDVGDVMIRPAQSLYGRVVAAPGYQLPAEPIALRAGFETAWDSQLVKADSKGAFKFDGLHRGQVEISLSTRGWRLSTRNRSLDFYNPFRMTGLLPAASTNVWIEIEPGQPNYNSRSQGSLPSQDLPQNRPLSGIEPGASTIRVAGSVVDDATESLINNVEILPGRQPPIAVRPPKPFVQRVLDRFRDPAIPWNELPVWYGGREENIENGKFNFEFEVLTSDPLLQVSAPGYEPVVVGPITTSTNGLVVRLSKGSGPGGTIILPDGQPADGATVIYGVSREQFGLNGKGELMDYGHHEAMTTADHAGKFSFPKRLEGKRIFISHKQGWLIIDEEDFSSKMKLRVEPWATVSGVLVDSAGAPVVGEQLILGFDNDDFMRGVPHINFNYRATTGSKGEFVLNNVPPCALLLNRIIPMSSTPGFPSQSWSSKLQTRFEASPGVTNDLEKVILDTPPPEPLLKRLEKKFGL
ncbi:hypothetical protein GC207_00865 [bacterium]|nr:hypothetical protein [bacterium]